jgi:peroxiredoxin Q/BCP
VAKKAVAKNGASKSVKKAPKKAAPKAAVKKASSAQDPKYKLNVGDKAPVFSLAATSGKTVKTPELSGKKYVLYFYPKDSTPGCTLEGHDFKRLHREFLAEGCEIFGVSQDSMKSHENFKGKCGFTFELIVDDTGSLCKSYDVIQMKSMYGKVFEGIERSTFVVDGSGMVRKVWRKVKVDGHAQEVLDAVKEL